MKCSKKHLQVNMQLVLTTLTTWKFFKQLQKLQKKLNHQLFCKFQQAQENTLTKLT